jgi:hypothetical protein
LTLINAARSPGHHIDQIIREFLMSTSRTVRIAACAAAVVSIVAASPTKPAAAAPLIPTAMRSTFDLETTQVRWRGYGGGGAGLAAGLATGLIIGGLLAAPQYYDQPYPYYYGYPPRYVGPIGYDPGGWEAYCFSRYRSFDPISGTYLGHDGRRHYCR